MTLCSSMRPFLLVMAMAICWLAGAQAASAQEPVTLGGLLRNGTANAPFSPESLSLTLRIFEGPVELEVRTAQPAPDGRFEFPHLPAVPGRTYFLSAEYEGAGYSATLSEGQLAEPVTLTVYEATTDPAVLAVTSHTIIVTGADSGQRLAEVLERVNVANTGDRTFVADLTAVGMPQLLRFALPPNAHNLDVRSTLVGGDVIEVDRGFAITTPVPPSGDTPHLFEVIYRVPYAGSALDMSRTLRFGAARYQVVVPADVATPVSAQLADLGITTIGGRELHLLEGADFAPGTLVELRLAGLPQPSLLSRLSGSSARWYMAAGVPTLMGLGLVLALGYGMIRRRPERPAHESPGPQGRRQALLAQIVRLDDEHQARGRSSKRYEARRRDLKRQMLQLDLQRYLDEPAADERS